MAQLNSKATQEIMEVLIQNGVKNRVALSVQSLINEVMKVQRTEHLQAEPYERSEHRKDQANGFKPRQFNTRMGELSLLIPQTRNDRFGDTL